MPISPVLGAARWTRQRKSCSVSSPTGTLKDATLVPWGLTPRKTWRIVPSFPPASSACRTTSSARSLSPGAVGRSRSPHSAWIHPGFTLDSLESNEVGEQGCDGGEDALAMLGRSGGRCRGSGAGGRRERVEDRDGDGDRGRR